MYIIVTDVGRIACPYDHLPLGLVKGRDALDAARESRSMFVFVVSLDGLFYHSKIYKISQRNVAGHHRHAGYSALLGLLFRESFVSHDIAYQKCYH